MSDKEKEILEEEQKCASSESTEEVKTEASNNDAKETTEENVAEDANTEETAADEADTEAEDASDHADEKEGGILKGLKKKDKKVEALETQKKELEDRVMRQMAEFENYRKRTEKEKSQMFEMGAKSVIEKMLPIVDNFERGLASIAEDQRGPVYDGMNMIYKQMMDEFDKLGVKPIEALGQEFNPDLHNAVMQVESEEFEEGIVAQELQKGYTYRDSVVRHSMVAVAQ